MTKLYIVPIEPLDLRYTKQWYDTIPQLFINSDLDVEVIEGDISINSPTTGAFLDFANTNYYKASQTQKISKLFSSGTIKAHDKFLITDAWNSNITAIRYMSDMMSIPVEIHSIWHAGSYDPTDILGYMTTNEWSQHIERGLFHASDYNYFSTNYHRIMFLKNLNIPETEYYKAIRSGQPHNSLRHIKQNQNKPIDIVWPHRVSLEKQPQIVTNMSSDIGILQTNQLKLKKSIYYDVLAGSKVVFSCSLHENLGIAVMESVLAGAVPIVPDRCSYAEMYLPEFKYPSKWTSSYESYQLYKPQLLNHINHVLKNISQYQALLPQQVAILERDYLTADIMVNNIIANHAHIDETQFQQ